MRKLRKVEVVGRQVVVYSEPPKAGSEGRRRNRHLRRSGDAKDELLKLQRVAAPLPVGRVLEVTRFDDFSYGVGEAKGFGDPIVAVYRCCDNSGFIDDFDRERMPTKHDKSLNAVRVLDDEGPRAALLAFLSQHDAHANGVLLRLLAGTRLEVEACCWGVFFLQPDELAGYARTDAAGAHRFDGVAAVLLRERVRTQ